MRGRPMVRVAPALVAFILLAPNAAFAQSATPASQGTSGFADLLQLMPSTSLGERSLTYSDYERQLTALGFTGRPAESDTGQWSATLRGMAHSPGTDYMLLPEWQEGFGFDLWDIDQTLMLNGADIRLYIVRGQFDDDLLRQAWSEAGYLSTEANGVTYHTLGEDHYLDFEHPVHTLHLGTFSHLLLLGDETVVASATVAELERVIELLSGQGTSMADGELAALVHAPADLVTAYVADGSILQPSPDPLTLIPNNPNIPEETRDRLATQVAEIAAEAPRMPPIRIILVGATAGALPRQSADLVAPADAPTARAIAIAVPLDPEAADTVADVAADRLATQDAFGLPDYMGQPYVELFAETRIATQTDGSIVLIELTPSPAVSANILYELLLSRNLAFLFWSM